ncbi:MAG: Mur ligase domain-containing protein, partial [Pseudomonadota bacterium]|nr:Mur ligase domain-containing protein [Pseudomonadota bacterium]
MLINLTLSDIATIVGGRLIGDDAVVSEVSTDSRDDLCGKLFVALVGERFNGNEFASLAIAQGATAVLVSEEVDVKP